MTEYSKATQEWLKLLREDVDVLVGEYRRFISTLPDLDIDSNVGIEAYFIWTKKQQNNRGSVGPLEYGVEDMWDDAPRKVRKEIGSEIAARYLAGEILKRDYNIDIMDIIRHNSDPCYELNDAAWDVDWEQDADEGCKRVRKIIRNKKCDRGTALYCYWAFCPDFYTSFESFKELKNKEQKASFKTLKEIEENLLNGFYKSNKILFEPEVPKRYPEDQKWSIPDSLLQPNISE